MQLREQSRQAQHVRNVSVANRPLPRIKYFGKWPFTRVLGMQVGDLPVMCPPPLIDGIGQASADLWAALAGKVYGWQSGGVCGRACCGTGAS